MIHCNPITVKIVPLIIIIIIIIIEWELEWEMGMERYPQSQEMTVSFHGLPPPTP